MFYELIVIGCVIILAKWFYDDYKYEKEKGGKKNVGFKKEAK